MLFKRIVIAVIGDHCFLKTSLVIFLFFKETKAAQYKIFYGQREVNNCNLEPEIIFDLVEIDYQWKSAFDVLLLFFFLLVSFLLSSIC